MRWSILFTVCRKELTEALRDRRTLLMALGIPVLLYPLIAIALTKLQESRSEAQEATQSKVAVWGTIPASLQSLAATNRHLDWMPKFGLDASNTLALEQGRIPPLPETRTKRKATSGSSTNSAKPTPATTTPTHPLWTASQSLILDRKVDAVLLLWPGFESELRTGGLAKAFLLHDSARDSSRKAEERLDDLLEAYRIEQIHLRESARQLPPGFSKALEVEMRNIAPPKRQAGQFLGAMLPFILILLSASGGLYAAIDLTAGEKERNTLQTLLCAPLTSQEIILGKFLAAWTIGLMTTLANLASMGATFSRILSSTDSAISAPASSYCLAFLVLLPVTFTLTAVFLTVAVFARDFKDGQNLLTPMMMFLTLPVGATTLPGVELNAWTSFVPLVNVALLIKGIFLSEAKPELVFFTLMSAALYSWLALCLAAKVFEQEQVLLGGRDSWRSLFRFQPVRRSIPTPMLALSAFAVVFVTVFYAGQLLQGHNTVVLILATQLGFFLLPNILMAWRWGFSPLETYQLRPPPIRAILGAVLLGLSAWGVTAGLVTRVFPPPEGFAKALEKVLLFEGMNLPLWVVWLLLGVTPAVCEELFFRGLVMSGFRSLGKWKALFFSALLFAIAHSSIYRLLPTLVLGILIGYATWQSRSMFTGIVIHALNNSLLVTFLHRPELSKALGFEETQFLPLPLCLGSLAVTAIGLWLVHSSSPTPPVSATPSAEVS